MRSSNGQSRRRRAAGQDSVRAPAGSAAGGRGGVVKRGVGQRLPRTILLGAAAVVLAIAWVARELQIDSDELLGFAGTSVVVIALFAVIGMFLGGVLFFAGRARRKASRRD